MLREVSFIEDENFFVSAKVKQAGVDWVITDVIDVCFLFTIEIADNAFTSTINQKRIVSSECAYFGAKGEDSGY